MMSSQYQCPISHLIEDNCVCVYVCVYLFVMSSTDLIFYVQQIVMFRETLE